MSRKNEVYHVEFLINSDRAGLEKLLLKKEKLITNSNNRKAMEVNAY